MNDRDWLEMLPQSAVAHLVRAFEAHPVLDEHGEPLPARAPSAVLRTADAISNLGRATVRESQRQLDRSVLGYFWYARQFVRGASNLPYINWFGANIGMPSNDFHQEEELGKAVWKIGANMRVVLDQYFHSRTPVELTGFVWEHYPAVVLETLNWPYLADDPLPPAEWPEWAAPEF